MEINEIEYLAQNLSELDRQIKKAKKAIINYQNMLETLTDNEELFIRNRILDYNYQLVFYMKLQENFQQRLNSLNGNRYNSLSIKLGYVVEIRNDGNYDVIEITAENIYCRNLNTGLRTSYRYAEVTNIVSKKGAKKILHPFELHEKYIVLNNSNNQTNQEIEVVAVGKDYVRLQEPGTDSMPRYRPQFNSANKEWRIDLDFSHHVSKIVPDMDAELD